MQTMKLNNGILIPAIGYGTWQTPDGDAVTNGIKAAVDYGYRHVDTAAAYENEEGVGKGILESGIAREELFVTSKVWNSERGYDTTLAAFEKSLKRLKFDYLDLYLIHWPASANRFENWEQINLDTWRAMTELYKAGKIKSIGVSNFKPHHLKVLMETEVKPMVNQIEFHPGMLELQQETLDYCKKNDIVVEGWSPLGTGRMLNNPILIEIAEKVNRSVAQVCIRWCIQHGVLPLPKSVTPTRIKQNLQVFDFELDEDDMGRIDALDNFGYSGSDPDTVRF